MRANWDMEEFDKIKKIVGDVLSERWYKDGGFDYLKLIGESSKFLIFQAEKHATQEEYVIKVNPETGFIKEYKED